jgi:hypothetical protein
MPAPTNTNQEWNIKPRGDTCSGCGKAFADQEPFFSRLTFGAEGYVRQDTCAACWQEPAKQGALSVWKSLFKVPAPPPPEPIKKETAESLLRELMQTDDPTKRNTIYILAVMLERRRVLVERDVQTRDDGVKVRVYEHRKTNETFLVPDPGLHLAELTQVQQEVLALLGGGPAASEAAPAPAAAAAPAPESPEA